MPITCILPSAYKHTSVAEANRNRVRLEAFTAAHDCES